jgi:hypothetical protein
MSSEIPVFPREGLSELPVPSEVVDGSLGQGAPCAGLDRDYPEPPWRSIVNE